jgi:DnaK suppressor protein
LTPEIRIYQERLQAAMDDLVVDLAQANGATDTVELDQTRVGRLSRMDAIQQQAVVRNTQDGGDPQSPTGELHRGRRAQN